MRWAEVEPKIGGNVGLLRGAALARQEHAAHKYQRQDGGDLDDGAAGARTVNVLIGSALVAVEEALNLFEGAALKRGESEMDVST